MSKTIDACGLACPAPVLLVKDTVESEVVRELNVIVDNEASKEIVSRFMNIKGFTTVEEQVDGNFIVRGVLDGEPPAEPVTGTEARKKKTAGDDENQKILVLIATERLGSGDDALGKKLLVNYIKTIREMGADLWHLVFVNGGVHLTIDSSEVLEEIQAYEQSGVQVLVCGTCLEHFGLTAEKKVGSTTNMLDIVTATQLADKVITLG